MAHARYSASQTKQWWECPGSLAISLQFPETRGGSGVHAQLGTCAHALIEKVLENDDDPYGYMGRIIEVLHPDTDAEDVAILPPKAKAPKEPDRVWFEVDDEMLEAVIVMVQYVRDRRKLMDADMTLEGYTIPLPERDDTGGTADVTLDSWPDELELIDYKNGSGVYVPIEGNKQLRSYILGRAEETLWAHDKYTYTIVQPRHIDAKVASVNGDGITSETITRDELLEFRDGLRAAAIRVDKAREVAEDYAEQFDGVKVSQMGMMEVLHNEGMISLGKDGSHCTFCDHKAIPCIAWLKKTEETVAMDFADDLDPLGGGLKDPDPDQYARILPWIPGITKFLDSVKEKANAQMMAGTGIEGYKIVRNNAKRVWISEIEENGVMRPVDQETLGGMIAQEFGLASKDLFTEVQLITGPAAEKQIKGKGSGERKKEFSMRFMTKVAGSLTIAPIGDRRQEVVPDAASDFDDDPDGGGELE
jgi:hypothetical protein